MRWDELFEDLESQVEAQERVAFEEDLHEVSEAEEGRIALADRIRACTGTEVVVGVDGESYAGTVLDATRSWVVVGSGHRDVLVPLTAVRWIENVTGGGLRRVAREPGVAESRLGLTHALREMREAGATVRLLAAGRVVLGVVDRVGLDHLEVLVDGSETSVAVPFSAVTSVALQ